MRHVPDPYRALGLSQGATEPEIKAAHRRLAKRYHPDSKGGDTERFLLVQEAYSLLSDPLRRREWDARHAPGPVRATERATEPARARTRARDGRWTRSEQAAPPAGTSESRTASGRDPGSRRYTWSASEVPWWEEGGTREGGRRPARRARPHQPSEEPAARPASGRADEPSAAGRAGTPGSGPEISGAQDFDVYNRSSGAAWSMAARAYFRRGDQDLPRRGSFHHEGSQPLTAARARAQMQQDARRATGTARATAEPAQGVVRDAEDIAEIRATARQHALAARWPSLGQRLLYALLAWIPVALIVGYGGAVVTGCDRASVSCPAELPTVQAVAITAALLLFVALPRLAYALALAAAGVALAGVALAVGIWVLGLRPPLAPGVLAVALVLLLLVHLLVATWVLSGSVRRPWAVARQRRLQERSGR